MTTHTTTPAPRQQAALAATKALCQLWLSGVHLAALCTIWWSFS